MSSPIDVMQEYLVSLGFKVNNTQLDGMLKSLDKAKETTNSVAGKMTKNLATGGVAIVSFIATATAAGDIVTLPISALVRLNCDCDTANLTIVIGGQVVTAQNLALVVEKE